MSIIRFNITSFTNHVIIQQMVNINQLISYANEIIMESMTNALLTIWIQIIMKNINNFRYVRRILNFTYKNPFRKRVLKCHLVANSSNCYLVLLNQTCVAPLTCCPIMSTTPKVPLKLQNVHFQNFLSIISAPNTSFKTKIWWHDVRCNKKKKKTHEKKTFCSWKISFTFCSIFENPIFSSFHCCLCFLLVFSSLLYCTNFLVLV